MDEFTVQLLQNNLCKVDIYKADCHKTHIFVDQMKMLAKTSLCKVDVGLKKALISFFVNCYLLQFVVLFSTLSITFITLFAAQSAAFFGLKSLYMVSI